MTGVIEKQRNDEPHWLQDLRTTSEKHFSDMPWPGPSDEEWRRTNFSAYDVDSMLGFPKSAPGASVPPVLFDPVARLTFSDGELIHESMDKALIEAGVKVLSLNDAAAGEWGAVIQPLLERAVARMENRFQSLNYSAWDHGAFVYVPDNINVDKPILLDFISSGKGMTKPHVVVHAGKGSKSLVVQRYLTASHEDDVLIDAAWEIQIDENATCAFTTIENIGDASLFVGNGYADIGAYGIFEGYEAFTGGKVAKSRLVADLQGSGADAVLNGLFLAQKDRHIDLRTVQKHSSPHAGSRSFYFGAAAETGRTIYQGLIEVAPGAAGTDAYLTNKNLILDDGARADAIPSLVIKTNDVRCSHGSTTGKISDDQLFYLMNRGFSRNEARDVLIDGFFEEAIGRAPGALQDELRSIVGGESEDG